MYNSSTCTVTQLVIMRSLQSNWYRCCAGGSPGGVSFVCSSIILIRKEMYTHLCPSFNHHSLHPTTLGLPLTLALTLLTCNHRSLKPLHSDCQVAIGTYFPNYPWANSHGPHGVVHLRGKRESDLEPLDR